MKYSWAAKRIENDEFYNAGVGGERTGWQRGDRNLPA